MKLIVEKTERLEGSVSVPPSKSHTHRAVAFASLAAGESVVNNPSLCDDCLATAEACKKFGAKIEGREELRITGVGGKPMRSDIEVNAGGSGTTMRFMSAVFALCKGPTTLTGDDTLRKRPMAPLLKSLAELGAKRVKALNGDGCPPIMVSGSMSGGNTSIDGESSQYLSALLLACPLAEKDSMIEINALNSKPYVSMTLEHLERARGRIWGRDTPRIFIPGGQAYRAFNYTVPGDWSAAAFLTAADHITDSDIEIIGLDPDDVQGDRVLGSIIGRMSSGDCEIDLADHPDLLPVIAVLGCYSDGKTVIKNAAHARKKESDRIASVCAELGKMGAKIEETADGLIIHHSKLRGAELEGHADHRIVMALAVAGLGAEGSTIINGADTVSKSYPGFVADMQKLGANVRAVDG